VRGIGVEALLEEEEYARTEAEQHHSDSCHDAEAGEERSAAFVPAPNPDVARNGDQQLQDAPL
jgi:hypothetical protein